jgi:hypothetical protein
VQQAWQMQDTFVPVDPSTMTCISKNK